MATATDLLVKMIQDSIESSEAAYRRSAEYVDEIARDYAQSVRKMSGQLVKDIRKARGMEEVTGETQSDATEIA